MASDLGGITRSGSAGSYTYSTIAGLGNMPVNYVSFYDSLRFANWLHNGQVSGDTEAGAYTLTSEGIANNSVTRNDGWQWAVTSEDEWYKAAYHKNDGDTGNYFDYPTSNDSTPSNDLVEPTDPGNNATFHDSGLTVGGPYYRTEVGAHENSASPYGTFDQGGNVWEWNETAVGSWRGARGGYWAVPSSVLHASNRFDGEPMQEGFGIGFRVASSQVIPEPGSVLVWSGLGVLGLIWWRRRK